jgi:hypothetical protein
MNASMSNLYFPLFIFNSCTQRKYVIVSRCILFIIAFLSSKGRLSWIDNSLHSITKDFRFNSIKFVVNI